MRRVIESYGKVIPEFQTPVGFRLVGWVYVLSNPAMPDLYKIGMTTSEPEIRAKEISQGTGVPLPFQVERAYYSENPRDDEKAMHEYLSCCRVNESREFFDASLMEIDMAAEDCGLHRRDEPISVLADGFNVICMNKRNSLNLDDLFDEIGITVFGCTLAAAEGLIRMASNTVIKQVTDGNSVIFNKNKVFRIKSNLSKEYEAHLAKLAISTNQETNILGENNG